MNKQELLEEIVKLDIEVSENFPHYDLVGKEVVLALIKQLDEPEVLSTEVKKDKKWFVDKWTKERNKTDVHDPMYHFINELIADVNQLDEPEVLSQEWIDEHAQGGCDEWIYIEDLQNLLMPNQEEVDRAYKDGYETGKKYTFYKGYLEGLVDKEKEYANKADMVNQPNHYIGEYGLEVEDVLRNFIPRYTDPYVGHRIASAIEYLLRSPLKNGQQDIEKARKNLDQALGYLEEKE